MEEKILAALQQLTVTVENMGKDLADVKGDMKTMQSDMKTMQSDMKTMQSRVGTMEDNLKAFRAGQQEQTLILGRLEELARVSEAKQDSQMYDHAALSGRVSTVEDTLVQASTIFAAPFQKAQ